MPYRRPYSLRFHLEGEFAQRSFWLGELPLVVRLSQAEPDGELRAEAWSDRPIANAHDQIMAAAALLRVKKKPTDADIDAAMTGNVCRCATYVRIRAAIKDAAKAIA